MTKTLIVALSFFTFMVASTFAKDFVYKAKSWCPVTNATGIGKGADYTTARSNAVGQCIGNGGIPACCAKYVKKI